MDLNNMCKKILKIALKETDKQEDKHYLFKVLKITIFKSTIKVARVVSLKKDQIVL
jgi:catabolite regulation protein CreA